MKKSILDALGVCLAVVSFSANAVVLESRLGGLALYDPDADLTWMANANANGPMNWANANAWAAGLDINGVTGWRLPDTVQPDTSCSVQGGGVSYGYDCSGSELGNLFYNVLGGSAGSSIITTHNANYDLFTNIQSFHYWSATEYTSISIYAWDFYMASGAQSNYPKTFNYYAWAVHSGDVSSVPVPAAIWLFGSGLIGLVGMARRKASR